MKSDPNYNDYMLQWSSLYQGLNYDAGLTGYFLRKSHVWSENDFSEKDHFDKVLEIGAGPGEHIRHVRHSFNEYWVTDVNLPMMDKIVLPTTKNGTGKIICAQEDATKLSFPDNTFDRVIATHVLEHLVQPCDVMREWMRVLKPGGVMTLVLPCDPGVAWRLGRYLVARKKYVKAGLDYDYWMAREHVNPINNLVSFVRYYFGNDLKEKWLPFKVASMDLNLFYVVHVRK